MSERKIVDCYLISRNISDEDIFIKDVKSAINNGWQPDGPCIIIFDHETKSNILYQKMVKYE